MKKIALCIVISFIAAFTACKKEKQLSTKEKITGRWQIEKATEKEFSDNTYYDGDYTGVAGDFLDLKSDGTYSLSLNGNNYTGTYSLVRDTIIQLVISTAPDGNAFDDKPIDYTIKTLTTTSLVLYTKRTEDNGEYFEQTLELKK